MTCPVQFPDGHHYNHQRKECSIYGWVYQRSCPGYDIHRLVVNPDYRNLYPEVNGYLLVYGPGETDWVAYRLQRRSWDQWENVAVKHQPAPEVMCLLYELMEENGDDPKDPQPA